MGLSACKSSTKTQYWRSKNTTNEKAKKQMCQKLVRDFSAEQKENVKDEVKRELDTQYKAHISSLSDDLMIEKQKHKKTKKELVQANKLNDSLTEMNIDYIENYVP
ncbi:hypothetical protein [Kitasatospora sp. NPDC058063]